MILDIQRGHVQLKVGDRTVTVLGEAYLPGHGSPDFVAYSNSIEVWDPPHGDLAVTDQERTEILQKLREGFAEKKMTLEIE